MKCVETQKAGWTCSLDTGLLLVVICGYETNITGSNLRGAELCHSTHDEQKMCTGPSHTVLIFMIFWVSLGQSTCAVWSVFFEVNIFCHKWPGTYNRLVLNDVAFFTAGLVICSAERWKVWRSSVPSVRVLVWKMLCPYRGDRGRLKRTFSGWTGWGDVVFTAVTESAIGMFFFWLLAVVLFFFCFFLLEENKNNVYQVSQAKASDWVHLVVLNPCSLGNSQWPHLLFRSCFAGPRHFCWCLARIKKHLKMGEKAQPNLNSITRYLQSIQPKSHPLNMPGGFFCLKETPQILIDL